MDLASQLFPRLTTVRVARHAMGRRAAEHLIARLTGEQGLPDIVSIGFEIVERESA